MEGGLRWPSNEPLERLVRRVPVGRCREKEERVTLVTSEDGVPYGIVGARMDHEACVEIAPVRDVVLGVLRASRPTEVRRIQLGERLVTHTFPLGRDAIGDPGERLGTYRYAVGEREQHRGVAFLGERDVQERIVLLWMLGEGTEAGTVEHGRRGELSILNLARRLVERRLQGDQGVNEASVVRYMWPVSEDLMACKSSAELALAKADGGQIDGAIADLERHVALDDADDKAWLTLGVLLGRIERWPDAASAFEHAVDLDGDNVLARVLYGRALERCDKLDLAVFQLLRAAKLDASNPGVLRELGSLFYKKGLLDKALPWLLKARAAAGADAAEQARALYAIGLVAEARRDPGAAIASYRECVRLDPAHLDARKTLADALAGIGEHAQAIAAFDDLLKVDPRNERAAMNREVLAGALEEMRARRLIGKGVEVLEASALVQAGQMKRTGGDGTTARYANALSELHVRLDDAHARKALELFLVLLDPAKASAKRDAMFQVTVVAKDGRREAATYATAVSLTFLREAMGVPMTQAGELYARLLSDQGTVEFGGLWAKFEARDVGGGHAPLNGLVVRAREG